jgi:hypothetical protein
LPCRWFPRKGAASCSRLYNVLRHLRCPV